MTALTAKITAIAVAAALALTGGLAIQMAQGNDPALAAKAKTSHATSTTTTTTDQATSTTDQATSAPATVTTRTS
jgi:hypothetical protein